MTVAVSWEVFAEFSRLHLAVGCPDPHLALAVKGLEEVPSPQEKIWRAGCYLGPYEVSTGAVIWSQWPLERTLRDPEGFRRWLQEQWARLQIRRERRAARTPTKMADALLSAARFAQDHAPTLAQVESYETLWTWADQGLRYFGRYALIKYLEVLHRAKVVSVAIPDIRPSGGWSPRETLAQLYPADEAVLNSTNASSLPLVHERSAEVRAWLSMAIGRPVTWYEVEVLLCNVRQIGSKPPGWPLDSDLAYRRKVEVAWGAAAETFPFFPLRRQLFPVRALGEIQGWVGPREVLGTTFTKYGYLWSDILYNFAATTDLAYPVSWAASVRRPATRRSAA